MWSTRHGCDFKPPFFFMSCDAKSVSSPPDAALFCQILKDKSDGRMDQLTVLFKVPVTVQTLLLLLISKQEEFNFPCL